MLVTKRLTIDITGLMILAEAKPKRSRSRAVGETNPLVARLLRASPLGLVFSGTNLAVGDGSLYAA